MSARPCARAHSLSRGSTRDLLERRPVLDHVNLLRGDPPRGEGRPEVLGDADDRVAPVQQPALEPDECGAERATGERHHILGCPLHGDAVDVLLPEDEANPCLQACPLEDLLGHQGRVARNHHLGAECEDARGESARILPLVDRPSELRVLLERSRSTDGLDCECRRVARNCPNCALSGDVARRVEVEHVVSAAGELAAQLHLERVPSVVVERDPQRGRRARCGLVARSRRRQFRDLRSGSHRQSARQSRGSTTHVARRSRARARARGRRSGPARPGT